MKLIAHRGNLEGPHPSENHPSVIYHAISKGFDVEVDVRWWRDEPWIGHDKPEHPFEAWFMHDIRDRLLVHAKDARTLENMLAEGFHVFYHEEDNHALTSNRYIVNYPDRHLLVTSRSIVMCRSIEEQRATIAENTAYAVCSDFVGQK